MKTDMERALSDPHPIRFHPYAPGIDGPFFYVPRGAADFFTYHGLTTITFSSNLTYLLLLDR
jgi:hypothetical protein